LAKPNYQYEKRQKDLAKKKKQEEKRLRKTNKTGVLPAETPDSPQVPGVGDTGPK
jgi:hypothetical protein